MDQEAEQTGSTWIFTHELGSYCCIIFHSVLQSVIICTICLKITDEDKVHREQRTY